MRGSGGPSVGARLQRARSNGFGFVLSGEPARWKRAPTEGRKIPLANPDVELL